jgi:DNA-binding NtrC family response regulator
MASGAFREDLYYRLQVFEITLPPLRERREDVLLLSQTFLNEIGKAFGRPPAGISREARDLLQRYHWPGNVRQLRHTLERAAILCEGGLIAGEPLTLPVRGPSTSSGPTGPLSKPAQSAERETGSRALADRASRARVAACSPQSQPNSANAVAATAAPSTASAA